jgi:Ca2+-binding EF-hand superfamily protein
MGIVLACLTLSAQETQPARGGIAERFKQLDRDGDGKVSAEEFPGPLFRLPIPVPTVLRCGP